jgi:hypothetical protein
MLLAITLKKNWKNKGSQMGHTKKIFKKKEKKKKKVFKSLTKLKIIYISETMLTSSISVVLLVMLFVTVFENNRLSQWVNPKIIFVLKCQNNI